MNNSWYQLFPDINSKIKNLEGPIMIFGAGGFIGINLLHSLLLYRKDVFGISSSPKKNWRFIYAKTPLKNLIKCDINNFSQLERMVLKIKPKTIFNLAAYGAYSKQKDYKRIYSTNVNAAINLIETLKKNNFKAYVQAGSSSEYGINCEGPKEDDELIPNSHYAVSKVASFYAIKYYGKIEKLPVTHLRLYSVYGPFEEPDRLIPTIIAHGRAGKFPPLVQPNISRDFIYVTDVTAAFIKTALGIKDSFGEAFSVGTGQKTSIKKLALLVKKICKIKKNPIFNSMNKKTWDLVDWYGDITKIQKNLKWKPQIKLEEGLKKVIDWQKEINYDSMSFK